MQRLAATDVSPTGQGIAERVLWLLFAAFAAAGLLFAFVGLSSSGYWTDELFTLFVMGHHGGLNEVLRRSLTDTHPPAYYFVIYEWAQAFGFSETALRLFSALCASAAAILFYVGLKGVFSRTARAFALAMSLNAAFWFNQSQNVRSYSLCMLISAGLLVLALAARRQVRAGSRFPVWPCAGLMLAGLIGTFCHSYVFLETGLVYVFLVLTVPSTGLRVALVGWGLVIAVLDAAFLHVLMQSTLQDVHHMWFRNDPLFFFNQITVGWRITYGITGWVVFVVLAVCAWRRRGTAVAGAAPDQDRGWAGGLGAFAHFGTIVLGIVISLVVAPSVSSINLAAAAPMLWTMMAWLYDTGGPRSQTLGGRAFAALLVLAAALHLPILAGRGVVRTEDWRGTARYIAALPACAGEPIPVLLPQRFSPDTPFFRTLAEQYFYGRYFPEPSRLEVYSIDELTGRKPNPALAALLAARAGGADPCPVLVWAVHDLEPDEAGVLRMDLQRRPELVRTQVQLKGFDLHDIEEVGYSLVPRAFVYLTVRPGATSAPGAR